jgi:hypothetical protein
MKNLSPFIKGRAGEGFPKYNVIKSPLEKGDQE